MKFSSRPDLRRTFYFAIAAIVVGMTPAVLPLGAAERYGVGATFDKLPAGNTTYERVQVRSINARTLMISHAGGLASVRLSELSPELQQAFGYDPGAAAMADAALQQANQNNEKTRPRANATKSSGANASPATAFERLLQSFGQPPEIRPAVDLRPKFVELSLGVKNQGVRPSCAVFAIVSALEFQTAQLKGEPERFSEEYLIWATRKTLRRPVPVRPAGPINAETDNGENLDNIDEGFALSEVVTALRAYGIPLQSMLPYTFGRTLDVADPPGAVVDEAKTQRRVSVIALPGRDQPDRIANLVQALNAGIPVAVGLRWPPWRSIRSGMLTTQRPKDDEGHAVTIVGYENKTGRIEDTLFVFKNSWGIRWGAGGYGFVSHAYLAANLVETALLEVSPPAPKPARG